MIWTRQEHRDLFWSGFLTGAVVGGALGVLLASEAGARARERLELAADQVRNRFNGRRQAEPQEPAPPAPEAPGVPESSKASEEGIENL